MNDDALTDFSGKARLFPLPNLVLFPHGVQPLHIFEPRYRQMTADALEDDRLIAMALPLPGWEADYAGKPALHPVACLGRVVAEQRLPDGRFNLLLRGVSRVRIVAEVPGPQLYRVARVELLAETPVADGGQEKTWRERLIEQAPPWFQGQPELRAEIVKLLGGSLGLGPLADVVAFALPLEAEFKQKLLEERDVGRRLERLLHHMGQRRRFPPEFSAN